MWKMIGLGSMRSFAAGPTKARYAGQKHQETAIAGRAKVKTSRDMGFSDIAAKRIAKVSETSSTGHYLHARLSRRLQRENKGIARPDVPKSNRCRLGR